MMMLYGLPLSEMETIRMGICTFLKSKRKNRRVKSSSHDIADTLVYSREQWLIMEFAIS